jgi:uncharacterized protein YndB with AHSA1/START domain
VVRIELTLEIARPADDVFEALTDLDRLPQWQGTALESRSDGPLAVGSRIHERRRVLGREHSTELEVVAFEPPSRLTLKALNGPVPFTVDHELASAGDWTSVRVVAEGKPSGALRLAGPMVKREAERELRGDFQRLKEQLEAGGYPSSSAPID